MIGGIKYITNVGKFLWKVARIDKEKIFNTEIQCMGLFL